MNWAFCGWTAKDAFNRTRGYWALSSLLLMTADRFSWSC